MNGKKKLVVVVLVLMMMVTAVAYAAWSDTIEVNGTATTGTFDVQWNTVASSYGASVDNSNKSVGNTIASDCYINITTDVNAHENDKVVFGFNRGEAGETYIFKFTAINKGTVNAKFTPINNSNLPTSATPNTMPVTDSNFDITYSDSFFATHTLGTAAGTTTKEFSVTIKVKDGANQYTASTKTFAITLPYSQDIVVPSSDD